MDVANTYAKLRGSTGFLIGLIAFIAIWLTGSVLYKFDVDHGLINLMLSAEASISLAFFAMLQDRTESRMQAQMDLIQGILQRMDARDQKMMEVVEDIHEEVDGN